MALLDELHSAVSSVAGFNASYHDSNGDQCLVTLHVKLFKNNIGQYSRVVHVLLIHEFLITLLQINIPQCCCVCYYSAVQYSPFLYVLLALAIGNIILTCFFVSVFLFFRSYFIILYIYTSFYAFSLYYK